MEAFRVICETCRSRLKIRSREVIGQIHACPKCGSMVQIVPPADWSAPAAAPAVAAVLPGAPTEPALTLSPSASGIIPADFAVDLPSSSSAAGQMEQFVFEPTAPTPAAAAPGISPVVWWAIGSTATLAVVGLTYALWPGGANPITNPTPAVAAVNPATNPQPAPTPSNADPIDESKPDPYAVDHSHDAPIETAASKPVDPAPAAITTVPQPDAPKVAEATTPTPSVGEAASPGLSASKPAAAPTSAASSKTPPVPTERPDAAPPSTNATASSHVLKFDPLDFDPEHLSLSSSPAASTSSIPAEPVADATPTAKPADTNKEPTADDLFPPPAANQAINVRRGPSVSEPSTLHGAAQGLAAQVKSLELTEMPLARFVETLSDMSGVPITLDPITLELNGASPRSAVSVKATDATLESILSDTLSGQRLEFVEQDGHAGIATTNSDEHRSVDFEVKDLAQNSDVGAVAKLIEQFVAPSTWQTAGGKGKIAVEGTTLHIDQSLVARREALIFCERLRTARGISLRTKYPPALLTVESPYTKLSATLNQSTTFTCLAWTRLADIVHNWQELSGLTILVDWSALADVNLGPSSPLACSAIERPWAESLDGILEPLNLAWWAVDSQTIQITSLEVLGRIERVEFYPIPKNLREQFTADSDLAESLQKEIAARPKHQGKPGEIQLVIDAPSGRLIVRATPEIHRFLSGRLNAAAK